MDQWDVLRWAASGGMWLTGHADGPPLIPASPVLARADALLQSLDLPGLPEVERLLFGRAAWMGLGRRGRRSAGGGCRLLATVDGWAAVGLARPSDFDSVGAMVGERVDGHRAWTVLTDWAASVSTGEVVGRAQLLGVPAAAPASVCPTRPSTTSVRGTPGPVPEQPLVVDLSSLWAGPLCAWLLGRAGARVVKVESTGRPDGARLGNQAFWRWLHAGHEFASLEFHSTSLLPLIEAADVVIEGSRPRALAQFGIVAEDVLARCAGKTWVSITGYGRRDDRVAFGDDAAVAGGLVARDADGAPVFVGDAIADPLAGLAAAAAARRSVTAGGGRLVEVALADVAAWASGGAGGGAAAIEVVQCPARQWAVAVGDRVQEVLPPRPPA